MTKKCFLMFSVLVIILSLPPVFAQEVSFGPSIRVDDDTTGQAKGCPTLAVDGDSSVYIAWHDQRDTKGEARIYFARSSDGGDTWSSNVMINDTTPAYYPSLDVDTSGNIYVVWEDIRNEHDVYFAMSLDCGQSWIHPNIQVNEDTPGEFHTPSLTVDSGGNIYVVWCDTRNGKSEIYFAKSTDSGQTWTTPNVRVSSPSGYNQEDPYVVVDDNGKNRTIYVVWTNSTWGPGAGDIYFAKSGDGGLTWSPSVVESAYIGFHYASPSLSVRRGVCYVVCHGVLHFIWEWDIYFAKSTDGGATWWDTVAMPSPLPGLGDPLCPSLTLDNAANIYVGCHTFSLIYEPYIFFSMSSDRGKTWINPIRVDDGQTGPTNMEVSIDVGDSGNVYIAWRGDASIWCATGKVTGGGIGESTVGSHQISEFRLYQNYPNPVNSSTAISYQLSAVGGRPSAVTLKIYNLSGQLVRTMVDEEQRAGRYRTNWDGRVSRGRKLSSGIYFCQLKAGDYSEAKKLLLLR